MRWIWNGVKGNKNARSRVLKLVYEYTKHRCPEITFVDIKPIPITPRAQVRFKYVCAVCHAMLQIFHVQILTAASPSHTLSTSSVDTNYELEYSSRSRKASVPPLSLVSQPDASDTPPRRPLDAPPGNGVQMQMLTSTL